MGKHSFTHPYIESLVGIRGAEEIIKHHIREFLRNDKLPDIKDFDRSILKSNFLTPAHGTLMWDCIDSPVYTCIYDDLEDRAHDRCIFCGLPEERK